jgi:hypothetical protein
LRTVYDPLEWLVWTCIGIGVILCGLGCTLIGLAALRA